MKLELEELEKMINILDSSKGYIELNLSPEGAVVFNDLIRMGDGADFEQTIPTDPYIRYVHERCNVFKFLGKTIFVTPKI